MKYLGSGRMRHAFLFFGVVIKIPKNIDGMKACFEEMILWARYKSNAMAPVLFGVPGLCVAMPYYAQPFTGKKPKRFIQDLNKFGITDLHPYNIRMHNGKPIAIDYAINRCTGEGKPGMPTGGW